jgi:hypothetical protein
MNLNNIEKVNSYGTDASITEMHFRLQAMNFLQADRTWPFE